MDFHHGSMAEPSYSLAFYRDEVMKSMPQTFKKFYGICICVLDCTEIFIERPTNLVARSQKMK